jgi:hypothetical protein
MNKIVASTLAIIGTGAIIFATKKIIHCVKMAKINEATTENMNKEQEEHREEEPKEEVTEEVTESSEENKDQ